MTKCKICSKEIANIQFATLYRKSKYCPGHLPAKLKCLEKGCKLPKYKNGFCKYHYKRNRKLIKQVGKIRCLGITKSGRQCRNLVHPELQYCGAHRKLESHLTAKDYAEYIKSKEWAAKSKNKRDEYGNRCRLCNSTGLIHTHHRTYKRLGHEHPEDLIPLCEPCHTEFHSKHKYDSKSHTFKKVH